MPKLLFRLQILIDRGIREGKKLIGPVIQSVYEGQPDKVRRKLLANQCCQAVFATASAWHTAISIACQRFESDDVNMLGSLALTKLEPYFFHHCQYVSLTPGFLVQKGRKIPIHIWRRVADRGITEELVSDGFGMGGHMGIKFYIPGEIYPIFRCRVGLASRHVEGQTKYTLTKFFIEVDKTINTIYSEEIDYGAEEKASCALIPGEPVKELKVDIREAKTLILRAVSEPHRDLVNGQLVFDIPHIAVCEPKVSKT